MPGEEQRTRSDGPKELPNLRLTRAEVALPKALGPGSEAPAGWSWTASSEGSTFAGGIVRPMGASPAIRELPMLMLLGPLPYEVDSIQCWSRQMLLGPVPYEVVILPGRKCPAGSQINKYTEGYSPTIECNARLSQDTRVPINTALHPAKCSANVNKGLRPRL